MDSKWAVLGAGAAMFAAVLGLGLWKGVPALTAVGRAVLGFALGAGAVLIAARMRRREG